MFLYSLSWKNLKEFFTIIDSISTSLIGFWTQLRVEQGEQTFPLRQILQKYYAFIIIVKNMVKNY